MAENVCKTCGDTFTTTNGRPPDPPICEDCAIDVLWGNPPPPKDDKQR